MPFKPDVTVAAVVQRDNRFLLVEEFASGQLVFNQPAGHLEQDETLIEAVARETLEETAWQFTPDALIGIYLWKHPSKDKTFLRFAFAGVLGEHYPDQDLDRGIVRATWMSRNQLLACQHRLRSPMVLRCIDDYLDGSSVPLKILRSLSIEELANRAAVV
jgi:8-oxo-dGTP pyrophosphatase MutT (NUDIX family)